MSAARRSQRIGSVLIAAIMVLSAMGLIAVLPGATSAGAAASTTPISTPAPSVSSPAPSAAAPTAAASSPAAPATATSPSTSLANRVATLESGLAAAHVQPDLLRLPNLNPAPLNTTTHVISYEYTKAPAPMGVSYYGISQTGASAVATTVDSSSVKGQISVNSVSAFYMDSTSPDQWGAQINSLANNATIQGASKYDFWVQNVIAYYGSTQTIQLVQNTWNFSSTAEAFPSSGQGSIVANSSGMINYEGIYLGTGPTFYAPAPFALTLYLNSSTASSTYQLGPQYSNAIVYQGDQELWYNYTLYDAVTGMTYAGNYNWLIFNSTNPAHPWANPGGLPFEASGSVLNPSTDLTADYEMDLGIGAFDGATQNVFNISATATISYANDCSGRTSSTPATCAKFTTPSQVYTVVPAAYDAGSQTGETASGISVGFSGTTAVISTGPSILHGLWGYTGETGVSTTVTKVTNAAQVSGSPLSPLPAQPYIFFFMEDTAFSSQGYTWVPDNATWTLMAGTYDWEAMLSDYQEQTGSFVLSSTPLTLTATLPYTSGTAGNGVYTPLWAFSNSELAGISSSGSGTLESQYTLFNNAVTTCTLCGSAVAANLSTSFYSPNDYDFPTFTAVQLMGTSAYVDINNPATTATWSGSTHAYLQMEFYGTSHLTLSNGVAIRGLSMPAIGIPLASQNILPQAAVMFWNSSNDLVYDNVFVAEVALRCAETGICSPNQNLFFYNNASVQADNTVWGNTFKNPPGVALGVTYGGLSVAENGDLIANNYFDVDNPIVPMFFNVYTELCYTDDAGYCVLWPYVDTWNVANQSATDSMVVNGFTLTGSVSGSSYQGGNFWWNYGNYLNPFSTVPYVDTFNYTDLVEDDYVSPATQASIYGIGDLVPLLPAIGSNPGYFHRTTFSESGVPSGVAWTVKVTGTTSWGLAIAAAHLTGSGATASILLPQGTYSYTINAVSGYYMVSTATGTFTSTVSTSVPIVFNALYTLTVYESGLPSASEWYVNYTSYRLAYPSSFAPTKIATTAASSSQTLLNGTYNYTVQTSAHGYFTTGAGALTVNGLSQSVSVTFTSGLAVSFTETGLAGGTPWSVTLEGSTQTTFGSSITFAVTSPTELYDYTVGAVLHYTVAPPAGTIQAGHSVAVTFTPAATLHILTFAESGLIGANVWSVTVGGQTISTLGSTIVFTEPSAGPFLFTIGAVTGYHANPSSGLIGGGGAQLVTFTPTGTPNTITLTETGLPVGASWSVSVGALNQGSFGSSIVFTETTAGSYSFTVAQSRFGTQTYAPDPASGSTSTGDTVPVVFTTLTAGAATPTNPSLDLGQSIVLSSAASFGETPYSYQWYSSASGTGACSAGALIDGATGSTYSISPAATVYICYVVTDSSNPASVTGSAWDKVTVNPVLTPPIITSPVTAVALDVNQALSVTGTLPTTGSPTFSWSWLISINGGAFAAATQCTTNSGTGGASGATETCAITASKLTATDTYSFELKATDSASPPQSQISAPSATVTVYATLTAPAAPTVSATALDVDQTLTVTGTLQSTGAPTFSWAWMIKIGSAAYVAATQCAINSGSGALAGAIETCVVAGGTLTVSDTYNFELKITDSATTPASVTSAASSTVTVRAALATANAPTVVSSAIDQGQSVTAATVTLPGTLGGSGTVSYAWLVSFDGGAYATATSTQCVTPTGTASGGGTLNCVVGAAVSVGTYTYEMKLTDAATAPEITTSLASGTVTVNTTPAVTMSAPTSAVTMDIGQGLTVTANAATGGTGPFSYAWTTTGTCTGFSAPGNVLTFTFSPSATTTNCVLVVTATDTGTTTHDSAATASSATVTVKTALGTPTMSPSSATAMDDGQSITVSASASGGTGSYSYSWSSVACPGAPSPGNVASFLFTPSGTGLSCVWTVTVTDTGTVGIANPTAHNSAATISVHSAPSVTISTPTSPTVIDVNQALTVTANAATGGVGPFTYLWTVVGACPGFPGSTAVSFTYTPSSTSASCAFTVTATDTGTTVHDSSAAATTATIVVNAQLAVSISTPTSTVIMDVGQSLTVTSNAASEGTGPYTYAWTITGSCPGFSAPGNVLTFSYTPIATTSNCVFVVTASDTGTALPYATAGASTATVNVDPALGAPTMSPLGAVIMDVGQSITVSTVASGGTTTGYSYAWSPSACPGAPSPGNVASFSYAPSGTGPSCVWTVTVSDTGVSGISSPTILGTAGTISVHSAPLVSIITPIAAVSMDLGQILTVSAGAASGGTGSFAYAWTVSGSCPGFSSPGSVLSFSYTPSTATASCAFVITATDTGTTAPDSLATSTTAAITVYPTLQAATPMQAAPGDTMDAQISGGSGPYALQWYSTPDASPDACSVDDWTALGTSGSQATTVGLYYCYSLEDLGTTTHWTVYSPTSAAAERPAVVPAAVTGSAAHAPGALVGVIDPASLAVLSALGLLGALGVALVAPATFRRRRGKA